MRYRSYKHITTVIAPLVKLWLLARMVRGKEDKQRFNERFGYASIKRPEGTLLWIHAASVGESNSVLPLIELMRIKYPAVNILLTTGTVTSAALMKKRLPAGVMHQYAAVDTPDATARFLRHWKPDIGFWVESEFWPNLVMSARKRGCFMVIINGRMSERSYESWQGRAFSIAYDMMSSFDVAFAQSEMDARRLRALGVRDVREVGNLKFDAAPLVCDESVLLHLQNAMNGRPVWLAASTHAGEETIIAQAHKILVKYYPNLLTIIAPRHPKRSGEIESLLKSTGKISVRSRGEAITANTSFYLADTLGELGLFYRLSEVVFMGGSLVAHGGQNPLEPARLRCAIITGNHTHNFADIMSEMQAVGAIGRVSDLTELTAKLQQLFASQDAIAQMQAITREWLKNKGGAGVKILAILAPIFGEAA